MGSECRGACGEDVCVTPDCGADAELIEAELEPLAEPDSDPECMCYESWAGHAPGCY